MSWKALAWASELKCEKAADKLILLGLAERHNTETMLAYPSTVWLINFSSLNRKTVLLALERLQEAGHIVDSGIRMGSTGGVKAWRLAYDGEAVPKTGPLKRSQNYAEAVPLFPEAVPKTGPLSGPKNGTQNRDIGTGYNRDRTKSASAIEKPAGVSDQTWADFVAHRKRKRADLTETALRTISKEAAKAGWSMENALAEIVTRGWQGFKADWVSDNGKRNGATRSSDGFSDAIHDAMDQRRRGDDAYR